MNQTSAEAITGLAAREVIHPPFMERNSNSLIGDQIRFQLGIPTPKEVRYMDTDIYGNQIARTMTVTVFNLIAWGPSFEAAVDMYVRKQGIGNVSAQLDKQATDVINKLTAA